MFTGWTPDEIPLTETKEEIEAREIAEAEAASARALVFLRDTNLLATATAEELVDQGEKITKMQKGLDKIEGQVPVANGLLSEIFQPVTAFFKKKFTPAPVLPDHTIIVVNATKSDKSRNVKSAAPVNLDSGLTLFDHSKLSAESEAKWKATDDNLDAMDPLLDAIHAQAKQMLAETQKQNQQLRKGVIPSTEKNGVDLKAIHWRLTTRR